MPFGRFGSLTAGKLRALRLDVRLRWTYAGMNWMLDIRCRYAMPGQAG
jgi:hypothetical protein